MEMTLNKANKAIRVLNEALKDNNPTGGSGLYNTYNSTGCVTVSVSSTKTEKYFMAEVEKKAKAYLEKFDRYSELLQDKNTIKKELFKKNFECGLSDVLSELDLLNSQISLYKSIQKGMVDCDGVLKQDINEGTFTCEKDVISKGDNPVQSISVSVILHDSEVISSRIVTITKEINKLEDKKLFLNAEQKIDIELSNDAMDLLGL